MKEAAGCRVWQQLHALRAESEQHAGIFQYESEGRKTLPQQPRIDKLQNKWLQHSCDIPTGSFNVSLISHLIKEGSVKSSTPTTQNTGTVDWNSEYWMIDGFSQAQTAQTRLWTLVSDTLWISEKNQHHYNHSVQL